MHVLRLVLSSSVAFVVGLVLVGWFVLGPLPADDGWPALGILLMGAVGLATLWSDRLRLTAIWFLLALPVALIASIVCAVSNMPHE